MLFFLHLYGILGCYRWPAYPTATQGVVASMGSLPPERSLDLHWNLEEKQKFWFSRKTEVLVFTEVLYMQCSSIWHDIFTSKSLLPWIRKGRPLYLLSKRRQRGLGVCANTSIPREKIRSSLVHSLYSSIFFHAIYSCAWLRDHNLALPC